MKILQLNNVRIFLAVCVLAGWAWLNWGVLPALGMIHLDQGLPIIPETGATVVLFRDGKLIGCLALDMIDTGWSATMRAWPYVMAGSLLGLLVGYPLGELARRELAIEEASMQAIAEGNALLDKAFRLESAADIWMSKASKLFDEAVRIKRDAEQEKRNFLAKSQWAQERIEESEEMAQKAKSMEKELVKAKAKIRRLENKIGLGETV